MIRKNYESRIVKSTTHDTENLRPNYNNNNYNNKGKKNGYQNYEQRHYHKIATEITAIVSGRVKMNGVVYESGDIITLSPGEESDFLALEDSVNVVVKIPGANDDKYLV